jgi:hypothetical protein
MKIGIKKIEFIPTSKIKNWGFLGRNASANIFEYLDGQMVEQKFTQDTLNLEEQWPEDAGGLFSEVTTSASIRIDTDSARKKLLQTEMNKCIFRVTSLTGKKYVIGSVDFPVKVSLNWSIIGTSTSECQITIYCKSLHGIITDTSL